jgi:hypothetical protein
MISGETPLPLCKTILLNEGKTSVSELYDPANLPNLNTS